MRMQMDYMRTHIGSLPGLVYVAVDEGACFAR